MRKKFNYLSKNLDFIFLILVTIISLVYFGFYYKNGDLLSYNDARSHLNIARRVIDNIQPGIAQFGGTWLPLYHILILPFVSIDFLWKTGIAGSIISVLSHILASYFIFILIKKITNNRTITFFIGLTYGLNPSLLFLQSIPMTESLTLLCIIGSIYFFYSWLTKENLVSLLLSGFFVMLSTLIRYDGWFLACTQITILIVYPLIKKIKLKKIEGYTALFSTMAILGMILWFGWQILLWNDPTYFLLGKHSARYQQIAYEKAGLLPTKHNLILSIIAYWYAIIGNVGILPTLIILLLTPILFFYLLSKKKIVDIVLLFIIASPIIFNILSLFLGVTVIFTPEIFPKLGFFNVRYGIMALPFFVILTSYFSKLSKYLFIFLIGVFIIQYYFIFNKQNITPLVDGRIGVSTYHLKGNDAIEKWFRKKYDNGIIMISVAADDPILTTSGLQMKNFLHEGVYKTWDAALIKPSLYAKYIIMSKSDNLWQKTINSKDFNINFKLVFQDKKRKIFKRIF